MEIPKLIILLCCTYNIAVSDHGHSHTIPIENYETELQDLGQHVEIPEHPVKIIKVTKTVAVKIPVPYPVKVVEKVPYPVHVAKPYPVPVPQIVHVPQPQGHTPAKSHHDDARDADGHPQTYGGSAPSGPAAAGHYQVQEYGGDSYSPPTEHSFGGNADSVSYFGISDDGHSAEGAPGFHSYSGDRGSSLASKNYDEAFKQHLPKQNANDDGSSHGFHYH